MVPVPKYSHTLTTAPSTALSQDRNGFVYLLDDRLNLLRLDSLGRPVDTFSPPSRGRISAIHAWNPMKMLLFYEGNQRLQLLDRFLRPISSLDLLNLNYQGTARLAAPAADDGYWLFDETSLTLAKLDMRIRQLSIETPLNLTLDRQRFDVRQLREYQNQVYLLDYNSGILVFDNLGNYKNTLPYPGVQQIGFRGNDLYFVQQGQLQFVDLYTQQMRSLPLPADKTYRAALVGGKALYLFTENTVEVYLFSS